MKGGWRKEKRGKDGKWAVGDSVTTSSGHAGTIEKFNKANPNSKVLHTEGTHAYVMHGSPTDKRNDWHPVGTLKKSLKKGEALEHLSKAGKGKGKKGKGGGVANEARDSSGKWTSGGGGGKAAKVVYSRAEYRAHPVVKRLNKISKEQKKLTAKHGGDLYHIRQGVYGQEAKSKAVALHREHNGLVGKIPRLAHWNERKAHAAKTKGTAALKNLKSSGKESVSHKQWIKDVAAFKKKTGGDGPTHVSKNQFSGQHSIETVREAIRLEKQRKHGNRHGWAK